MRALTECLCCGHSDLEVLLDFGSQPLANTYPDAPTELPEYPLALNYCYQCSHLQLTHSVNRDEIFSDYPYVSGTTLTLREDFRSFAALATQRFGTGTVLDIACNDGSQLNAFQDLGWKTIGIDPAQNLYELSSKRHQVYCDFLGEQHSGLKADLIVAQNVLAHTDDPLAFLKVCQRIAPVILIQTSQANMVANGEFDTIYHEHLSFFSERSMQALARRAGLVLTNISKRPVHGTSFLFELRQPPAEEAEVLDIASPARVTWFAESAAGMVPQLREIFYRERAAGRRLIGYGAAAKGMTVLNAVNFKLDYIVDDNPLKHNLFTPGLNIPILPPTALAEENEPATIIPLAWNFYPEIKAKVESLMPGPKRFIKYFPTMEVE